MNRVFESIDIPENEPFKNCALGRKKYADILEAIVSSYQHGVISLNGEWGTGKTTFVKMWRQQLENNGYTTLYYNAWETDFVSDPMISLVGELQQIAKDDNTKSKVATIATNTGKLLASAIPSLGKHLIKYFLGEEFADIASDVLKKGESLFEKGIEREIKEYKDNLKSLNSFRNQLTEFAKDVDPDKPLVFFVDELDRCNPHFAVKVLERIKHLFSVPHIIFVLSIDRVQLSHSICGFYGSEKINSSEYLRRFIDVEYNLPKPNYEEYFKYLYRSLGFDDLFNKYGRTYDSSSSAEYFQNIMEHLISSNHLSLRQIEKILSKAVLVFRTFSMKNEFYPNIVALLVYIKEIENDVYNKILLREYNAQGLLNSLCGIVMGNDAMKIDLNDSCFRSNLWYTIVGTIVYYNNYDCQPTETLVRTVEGKTKMVQIHHKSIRDEKLLEIIENLNRPKIYITQLSSIVNHIELLSGFQE